MSITTIAAADFPDDDPDDPAVLDLVGMGDDDLLDRSPFDGVEFFPRPSPTSNPPSVAGATPYLTPGELADRLQVSERTVADWRYQRTGPRFRKFGRRVRYHIDDVCSWEDCH